MSMDKLLIENVLKHARKGHKVYLKVGQPGHGKVKIKHGPLKMLTTRYEPDLETFDALRMKLSSIR